MYENHTKQLLLTKDYLELLGIALCVFLNK